jgi:DOPA 4,5-dioxygenase
LSAASPGAITGYHAHIYYDTATRESAARLRTELVGRFIVRLGRWRDTPVGPHPVAMFQAAFEPEHFSKIVPWLMVNHGDHAVLIHPETGNDLGDHRDYPLWLGEKLALDFSVFR